MTPTICQRETILLVLLAFDDDRAAFCVGGDPVDVTPQALHAQLIISRELWDDMGCPSEVTVTVEPGDKLN